MNIVKLFLKRLACCVKSRQTVPFLACTCFCCAYHAGSVQTLKPANMGAGVVPKSDRLPESDLWPRERAQRPVER